MELENIKTLEDGKKYLRERMDDGALCPCCNQNVKMYRWKISGKVGVVLIDFYHNRNKWVHPLKDLGVNNGDYAKLRHFGLVVADGTNDEDKKASGLWQITPKGIKFVEKQITVHEKVKLYNNHSYGFEGDQITIEDALGTKFSFKDLMKNNGDRSSENDGAV